MKSRKKKRSPVITSAIISLLLIVAIIGSIIYKYDVANRDLVNENNEVVQNEGDQVPSNNIDDSNVEQTDQPLTKENEATQPKDGKGQSTGSPNVLANGNETVKRENGYIVGQPPAKEPTFIKDILIANKNYPLPATYKKGESATARAALNKMIAAAKEQGFILVGFSGYRSYEYQTDLYNRYAERDGKDAADRYSARPGYSEHQTGLTFDIGEKGKESLWLTNEFGETPAGKWLAENAHQYGFIMRYPEGKEDITGYMYESWHFRYLEGDLAKKIYTKGVTLEEYLGIE